MTVIPTGHSGQSNPQPKLKPCPFCGAKAMLVYCVHGVGANWGVECTETHAHRIEFSGTQDEIIKEWNRRAKE